MTAADRYRATCAALGLPVWRPGMLSTHGARVLDAGLWASSSGVIVADENDGEEPDFADFATVGCLLAAVREVLGDPRAFVRPTLTGWAVLPGDPFRVGMLGAGPTEADALIAALEAAARRGGQP